MSRLPLLEYLAQREIRVSISIAEKVAEIRLSMERMRAIETELAEIRLQKNARGAKRRVDALYRIAYIGDVLRKESAT